MLSQNTGIYVVIPLTVNKAMINLQANNDRFSDIFRGYKTEELVWNES